MGTKTILFFIGFMVMLTLSSVWMNFWLPLLIVYTIIVTLGTLIGYYVIQDYEDDIRFLRRNNNSSDPGDRRAEERLRDRIENEWDGTSFDNPEDLR